MDKYIDRISMLEKAKDIFIRYNNSIYEYEEELSKIKSEPFVPTKGIMPQYVLFIVLGALNNAIAFEVLKGFEIVSIFYCMIRDKEIPESFFRVPGTIIGLFLISVSLFLFIGGVRIAKRWHYLREKRIYDKRINYRIGLLSGRFDRMEGFKRYKSDYFRENDISPETTMEDIEGMLQQAIEEYYAHLEEIRKDAENIPNNIVAFKNKKYVPRTLIVDDCDIIYEYVDDDDE